MPSLGPSDLSVVASRAAVPAPNLATRTRVWGRPLVGIGVPLLLGLVHVALVAPHYHVGSFDDDASYILTAKALLGGQGLTGHLTSGTVIVGLYPPGYSALIAPLVWLWPHSFVDLRLLSVAFYAAVFPLTWVLMERRRLGPGVRVATLLVLALGPPFATYGTMVMAETPFLVALVLLVLAVDKWDEGDRALSKWGVAAVLLAGTLVWLKQAGIGLVAGLVLWMLASRRRWRKGVLLASAVGAMLLPVVVARIAVGLPLEGGRYSVDLGGFYHGNLLSRLEHVLPSSCWHLLSTAIPRTLVPYGPPLPVNGHWPDAWKVLSWHVTVFIAVGAVRWGRRYRDAAVPMVAVYMVESVLWPFVNERRAILVLPLLVIWYVTGAATLARWASSLLRRRRRWPQILYTRGRVATAAILAAVVVVVPSVAQMPRDYLFGWGQSSSHFGGSRYAAILARLGSHSDVVETDYRSSTALFTGHRTAWTAFTSSVHLCYEPAVLGALRHDAAAFLLLGDVNKPHLLDSPCLAGLAQSADWAVRLLHTARDDASVYELIGPGTGHPRLSDLRRARLPTVVSGSPSGGAVPLLPGAAVEQVSVGEAYLPGGRTTSVLLQLEEAGGTWRTVASSGGPVGDGGAPFLLTAPVTPVHASAARVVIDGAPGGTQAVVQDLQVLGYRSRPSAAAG